MILPLTWWSLFHQISRKRNRNYSLSYIEVLPFSRDVRVSRYESKFNLHEVIQDNVGCKIENDVFDKVWYIRRTEQIDKQRKIAE